jgi:hypothetical protein
MRLSLTSTTVALGVTGLALSLVTLAGPAAGDVDLHSLVLVGSDVQERASGRVVQSIAGADPALTARSFRNPPNSVRPGTRWWWGDLAGTPAATVSLPDALKEVDAFHRAGFGRFEIAWGGDYGTPTQQENLKAVAARAAGYGMQVDMTLGAGWPWASPQTTGKLGQQQLMYGRDEITGPATYDSDVPTAIGDVSPSGTLVAVTAARVVRSGPAVTTVDSPPSSSTVLDPASLVDLTGKVDGHHLTWQAPAGDWIVFAFWMKARSESNVSLIDDASVRAGLKYVDDNQLGAAEGEVEKTGYSFFEDSVEYKADELYWEPQFLSEFATRRGYAARKYLPLMFVQKVSDYAVPQHEPVPDFILPAGEGARYRHDYYETLTDLYLDNHVKLVAHWARKYGMRYRAQLGYGNDFDTIRSAREAVQAGALADDESLNAGDTPFLGNGPAFDQPSSDYWKFALDHYRQVSSGSQQAGGREVTSELGAWFGHDLATSLREYRHMMDKEWAGGVTRVLLHGYTHSPAGTPWPGAARFAGVVGESLNFRTWPEWRHLRQLNDYWGRGALVLQQGAARTDVAVLRDSFITTAAGGSESPKPLFDTRPMETSGYTIGYVDPEGVTTAPQGGDGELYPAGPSYKALVVDGSQFYVGKGRIPGATAAAIARANARGLRVVFVGNLPRRGLSGVHPSAEDRQVHTEIRRILHSSNTAHVASQAQVAGALRQLHVRPAVSWRGSHLVYTQRRQRNGTSYYYLWNATGHAQDFDASFAATGTPDSLDLWNGTIDPEPVYRSRANRVSVPVHLATHGTAVIRFRPLPAETHLVRSTADQTVATSTGAELIDFQGGPQTIRVSTGRQRTVVLPSVTQAPIVLGDLASGQGLWQLQATTTGPEGDVARPAVPLPTLADWRTIPGLTSESGTGHYSVTVTVPDSWTNPQHGAVLDLGPYDGSVRVAVNGHRVGNDIDPTAALDVTRYLRAGDNEVTVELSTTPFNKAVACSAIVALTRPLWPASLANGPLQPYGLLGPVRLIPYARADVGLGR